MNQIIKQTDSYIIKEDEHDSRYYIKIIKPEYPYTLRFLPNGDNLWREKMITKEECDKLMNAITSQKSIQVIVPNIGMYMVYVNNLQIKKNKDILHRIDKPSDNIYTSKGAELIRKHVKK